MLDTRRVTELALDAARAAALDAVIERISTEEAIDSVGEEALDIRVVLKPDWEIVLKSDSRFLLALHDRLQTHGDYRVPTARYSTEEELRRRERKGADA